MLLVRGKRAIFNPPDVITPGWRAGSVKVILHCVDHLGMTVVLWVPHLNSFNCPKNALDKVMIFMDLNVLGVRFKKEAIWYNYLSMISVIVYIVPEDLQNITQRLHIEDYCNYIKS